MKLGIAGCGLIVEDVLRFVHSISEIELCAIAGRPKNYEKVQQMAKEHGMKHAYEDFDTLLGDREIDTVYLGVPNHVHYAYAKQAMEAGKNVICEKPFTSNYDELLELAELAEKKHVYLFEAISTLYLPNTLKIQELLPQIGEIRIVSANFSQYSRRYDAFKRGEILPAFDAAKSGGALMDLNIYNVHLLTALFGAPKSVHYQANVVRGIDTSGILFLDYGTFKASSIGAKDCKSPVYTSIQGDRGCIQITSPANALQSFELILNDGTKEIYDLQGDTHRMSYEFREFERMLAEDDYAGMREKLEENMTAMKILTDARKSAGIVFPADRR